MVQITEKVRIHKGPWTLFWRKHISIWVISMGTAVQDHLDLLSFHRFLHLYHYLFRNPNIAAKQKKSKADELKERPRFKNIVTSSSPLGGFKSADY